MKLLRIEVKHSSSRLSFSTRKGGERPWWRYLDFDGQPLYLIGNVCDTCEAVFGLAGEASYPLAPAEISQLLRSGLDQVPQPLLESVQKILPDGNYIVGLILVQPTLQESRPPDRPPKSAPKYDNDPAYRHSQRPDYYWSETGTNWQELFLPSVARKWLSEAQVQGYCQQIQAGQRPTALAFTVMDRRIPSGRYIQNTLAHFILDGHHKLMAASQLNAPISLLSFLNVTESWAIEEDVLALAQRRYLERKPTRR